MTKNLIILAAAALMAAGADASEAQWMRYPAISPDGTTIAFAYKGDIFTVPSQGGTATRLTTMPSYEYMPVWSPDGNMLAFASDRGGTFDVYVMPAKGGQATRLTHSSISQVPMAFSPDGKDIIFAMGGQQPATSVAFPTGRNTQLYAVAADGKAAPRQISPAVIEAISFIPGTNNYLYQDGKGMENTWRKHHTSSVTRDIWLYDAVKDSYTNVTDRPGEDRQPVVAPDGDTFFYLSEPEGGTFNVYQSSISNPKSAKALTDLTTHPVRFLSGSKDASRLAFAYDGSLYTLTPGQQPQKINVDVVEDIEELPERINARNMTSAQASPDGSQVALTLRGDVYVTSVKYNTTKQVTDTPAAESDVSWAPDGKSLLYTSDRDGHFNIYRATMGHDDDPNWANATVIEEEALFPADDGHERAMPKLSPDGSKLAFVLDRRILAVMDTKTKAVKELTTPQTHPHTDGELNYVWSPDSKWLALELNPKKHDPYSDLAIVNVESGETVPVTNTGYFDANPRWAFDGQALAFATDRRGYRNHASWGSLEDVMVVFLNRDAYNEFRLNDEDLALYKDAKEKAEKAAKTDKKSDKKSDKTDNTPKIKPTVVEPEGLQERIVTLTPYSVAMGDFYIDSKGENLFYTAQVDGKTQLWRVGLDDDAEHRMVSRDVPAGIDATPDGKNIFLMGSSGIKQYNPAGDKLTGVNYKATKLLDHAAEREYMFDEIANTQAHRFYDVNMHGVDWPMMTQAYRRFLPYINNNYDYAELVSELLGELNVSHTGGRYYHDNDGPATAALGLLYDVNFRGPGLKVEEVIAHGPWDNTVTAMAPGAVITAVNGKPVPTEGDWMAVLDDLRGHKTLVTFTTPTGKEVSEVIKPLSRSAENALMYDRWVAGRAKDVDKWSNGRLGYVHVQSMDDASFRRVYADLLGKYNDREGVVVDIRWNGGGRLHEDLEVLLSGKKYLTQIVRGVESCDMPSRRWNKPSVMVVAEPCYSNAHGSPWVYKHQGLGKLVGMPVPGTMTSVNWITMQDPSLIYGIPVLGYKTAEGTYLENSQLEPDVKVQNLPGDVARGYDAQLHEATMTLLHDIDAAK